jgi:hypothetical protein
VNTARLVFIPVYPYVDEAIRLCGRAKTLVSKMPSLVMLDDATKIVKACKELERKIEDRFGDIINDSLAMTIELPGEQNRRLLAVLHTRNYIDACFICLHYSILELLIHIVKLPDIPTAQREDIVRLRQTSIQQSQLRAESILMSLPSFLPKSST